MKHASPEAWCEQSNKGSNEEAAVTLPHQPHLGSARLREGLKKNLKGSDTDNEHRQLC